MKPEKIKECKSVRDWLRRFLSKGLKLNNSRLYEHVLTCPKCQQRLVSINKIDNALMMMKSEIHTMNLLARANKQAIGVLKHSLRENPATIKLEDIRPRPSLISILSRYNHGLINTAACFVIFLLVKTHVFNSIEDFQAGGNKIMTNYYERQLGSDLADELNDS